MDADSCPSLVRKIILKTAASNSVPVVFVANRKIPFDFENKLFSMVVCPKKSGAADDYICNNIEENDIAVTRDLPLADRLLKKSISVMNDRGILFDRKTLDYMLEERELSMQMQTLGIRNGSDSGGFSRDDVKKFADCFCPMVRKRCGNS
ncbi:MAG: DUF188 domain-containing protein [Treponema sp.]|nr:DUF188 domain-containing protein [Treponema sp.]